MLIKTIWRRLRAERGECAFIDMVVHKEVWVWRYAGKEWLGHSRWSMWMERKVRYGALDKR